jgi:hypothetical protein
MLDSDLLGLNQLAQPGNNTRPAGARTSSWLHNKNTTTPPCMFSSSKKCEVMGCVVPAVIGSMFFALLVTKIPVYSGAHFCTLLVCNLIVCS